MKKKLKIIKTIFHSKKLHKYHKVIISGIHIESHINEIYQLFQFLINDDIVLFVKNSHEFDDENKIRKLLLKNEQYGQKNGHLEYIDNFNIFQLKAYFKINMCKINAEFFQDMLNGFEEIIICEYPSSCKILEQIFEKNMTPYMTTSFLANYLLIKGDNNLKLHISNRHKKIKIGFNSDKINSDELVNKVKEIFKFE